MKKERKGKQKESGKGLKMNIFVRGVLKGKRNKNKK